MSTLIDEEKESISSNTSVTVPKNNNHYCRHVLKPKNIFKHKCCRDLRRKLKKYKLRKDGKEDEDVLDVSQNLLHKLRIKSPTKSFHKSPNSEQPVQKNYLFKMPRRKQKQKSDSPSNAKSSISTDLKSPSLDNVSPTKKQTNAFQLMMDSRNKSIGSNSPGKEKVPDPNETQELIEKKNAKAKRNLALQKMAVAKGALKKKEVEEYQEECVKQKMEKRAERLKTMIKNNIKPVKVSTTESKKKIKSPSVKTVIVADNKSKSLTLVDLFEQDDVELEPLPERKKQISKDDEEFINKLSPSIKKKENMLCYFKKVEKSTDSIAEIENDEPEDVTAVIKVKLAPRKSKKAKSRKLSLNKNEPSEILKNCNDDTKLNSLLESKNDTVDILQLETEKIDKDGSVPKNDIENDVLMTSNETRKRKRRDIIAEVEPADIQRNDVGNIEEKGRPKRVVKKPTKYFDNQLSSSDEEPHIFTPKKRKQVETKAKKSKTDLIIDITDDEGTKTSKNGKSNGKAGKSQKKPTKLAPIFASKPQLTAAEVEAKHKFLHSGIPDQLKRVISKQKNEANEYSDEFPIVVHIHQNESTVITYSHMPQTAEEYSDSDIEIEQDETFFEKCINTNTEDTFTYSLPVKQDPQEILQTIKEAYPKFPVYRTYRSLREKRKGEVTDTCPDVDNSLEVINITTDDDIKENPGSLSWTDKYKATSSANLIGNFESIKELKKWLVSWTENQMKRKGASSDSSDFYDSDSNSRDNYLKAADNLLLLHGPAGSGKTSSVYAVAAELAIKVIEVNASSRRTGKLMLQDLQEATQSHKVNRRNMSSENSQKSQEVKDSFVLKTAKKKGRPKKLSEKAFKNIEKNELSQQSNSQEAGRTAMSLILIDDADIVFEQDDGFSSAIGQLTQSSKRPVILVTSSVTCPHLQRYVQYGRVLKMQPLLPKMLGTWLDIMCLADIGNCWIGLGAKFLNYYRGDIRKTINSLQFYLNSQTDSLPDENSPPQIVDNFKLNIDDENSSMSWAERDIAENRNLVKKESTSCENGIWNLLIGKQCTLTSYYPLEIFNIWWSVPELFSEAFHPTYSNENDAHVEINDKGGSNSKEIDAVFKVLDSLSVADSFCDMKYSRIKEHLSSQPWLVVETDSVSEDDNLQGYNRNYGDQREFLQEFVAGSVLQAQNQLHVERKLDIQCPSMAMEREKHRVTSRYDNVTDYLPPTAILDRRGLALDYWSTCRTICRAEKAKTDTVLKRNNRFLHYLKCLNPVCKNDTFNKLGDSLSSGEYSN